MNLKLASLNVWGRTGPWARRKALIRQELEALAPDVIGLQEIWLDADGNLADELVDGLGYHVHYAPAYDYDVGIKCGNAIAARWPITDGNAWALTNPPGDTGRNVVYGRVQTPHGELPVFVTHLSWMFHQTRARLIQVQEIAKRIAKLAPIQRGTEPTTTLPPVLMGDLNTEADSDEIRYLRGLHPGEPDCYLADCFGVRGHGPGITFSRANGYAAREHYPDRRIDYIFVRGPDRWHRGEPRVARVAFDREVDGVWPSDHYGVYAEIRATPVVLPALDG